MFGHHTYRRFSVTALTAGFLFAAASGTALAADDLKVYPSQGDDDVYGPSAPKDPAECLPSPEPVVQLPIDPSKLDPNVCTGRQGELSSKNYQAFPIRQMRVTNASRKRHSKLKNDPFSDQLKLTKGQIPRIDFDADFIVNGGFVSGNDSLVAVVREGQLDMPGVKKAWPRGGVAVLRKDDQTRVVLCETKNPYPKTHQAAHQAIEAACLAQAGEPGWVLVDFMGGGVSLIHDGSQKTDAQIKAQNFEGLHSGVMRPENHTVIAMKGGVPYLVIAKRKSGAGMRKDLCQAGFESAVKFDGGGGFFVRSRRRSAYHLGPSNVALGLWIQAGE